MQGINLPNKKLHFLPTALEKSPTRNVMKSSLSKQRYEISNLFQLNKRESALRPINALIISYTSISIEAIILLPGTVK